MQIIVHDDLEPSEDSSPSDLVMAWASDITTGEPRYIGELKEQQGGAGCHCKCISCHQPLIAVNAGKRFYKRRPHFRHYAGSEKNTCLVVAARAAALSMLQQEGVLQLPQLRKSAGVTGLSGTYHSAWIERPAEQVKIDRVILKDMVDAILYLDDGRQLRVKLVGEIDSSKDVIEYQDSTIPTLLLAIDDPHVVSLSPSELRTRLRLIVSDGVWCSHWAEKALLDEAHELALAKAKSAMDWIDNDLMPDSIPASLRRETLLHLKAKEVLEREKRIHLPDLVIEANGMLPNGQFANKSRRICGSIVQLHAVQLEKSLGSIKPDVVADVSGGQNWQEGPLLIEITVTNAIDQERLERIRRVNIPAIEIDIGRMGGIVTEAEFTNLLVEEKVGKRWLHHPIVDHEKALLEAQINVEIDQFVGRDLEKKDAQRQLQLMLSVPVTEWAQRFLDAILIHSDLRVRNGRYDPTTSNEDVEAALDQVKWCAKGLSAHGYKEAEDEWLFSQRGNLIERLLSIKLNRAIGYELKTAWQVINTVLTQISPLSRQWQTIYLIGIRIYGPTLTPDQKSKVEDWRRGVINSLKRGEQTFLRQRRYDRILSLLFPDMANALAQPLVPTMSYEVEAYRNKTTYRATKNNDVWLKGKELEEWVRQHPESARRWFSK